MKSDIDISKIKDTRFLWKLATEHDYIDIPKDVFLPVDVNGFFLDLIKELGLKNKIALLKQAGLAGTDQKKNKYGYEVLSGKKQAAREYYIKIALSVGLDLRTTQRMLAISGLGFLHSRSKSDAAIMYAIIHKMDFAQYEALDPDLLSQENEEDDQSESSKPKDTHDAMELLENGGFPRENVFLPKDISRFFDVLLDELGTNKTQVVQDANLSSYGYEILSGEKTVNGMKVPCIASRDYYIRIALALGLDIRSTQRMLAITGRGCLYPKIQRDFALIKAISRKFNNIQTYDYLLSQDLKTLEKDE